MTMAAASSDNMIRVRLEGDLRESWKDVLDARGISQQRAVVATIGWLVRQDALTQAMIFGQVPDTDHAELSRIVLKRLAADGEKRSARGK